MTSFRLLPLFLLAFAVQHATAQCCCADVILHVDLSGVAWMNSEHEFSVDGHALGLAHRLDSDSTDRRLVIWLDAGCGTADRKLTITRTTTGERMELRVLYEGFEGSHPGLRIPFVAGNYEIDLERIISCTGALERQMVVPPVKERLEVLCGTCRVLMEHDSLGVWLEPLDLCCGACGTGGVGDMGNGKASFPAGQLALEQAIVAAMAKRGKALRRPITLNAVGFVNERGESWVSLEGEHSDVMYDVEVAAWNLEGWVPAYISAPEAPDDRRTLRSMVRFKLDLRPSTGR
ncbi:MAG TPA: hypothetical protein PLB89_06835 [Flavobacteriales bacterium]|nr:hypothetical protein [Flavobacteriales bacterium]